MQLALELSDCDRLIVTAALDARSQTTFNELRAAYFPPERNYLDAHVTLFHALPALEFVRLFAPLCRLVTAAQPMPFVAPRPYKLGNGVAIAIDCPPLVELRAQILALLLAERCELTRQDQHKGQLHVTVQNKVSTTDAARSFRAISDAWSPRRDGRVLGLTVWRYLGGPWQELLSWPLVA